MTTAFLFPGQGSQHVGMARELHEHFATVRGLFELASDVLKLDASKLCFEGPEEVLKETVNAQPMVTLVNIACFSVLKSEGWIPAAVAGHSLGEYAALHAAGVLSVSDTLALVRARGQFMQQAADIVPGGMIAVIGFPLERLAAVCERASGAAGSVEIANINTPSQIVITGEAQALKSAVAMAKSEGAKLMIPLKVSGAWHSRYMAPAAEQMVQILSQCKYAEPAIPVMSNVSGKPYQMSSEVQSSLARQMTSPVLWEASIQGMINLGLDLFVEVGPGKALVGMTREISKAVKTVNVENLVGIQKLNDLRGNNGPR